MKADYSLKLNVSEQKIFNDISKLIIRDMKKSLDTMSSNITTELRIVLKKAIEQSDVYHSLVLGGSRGDNLRAEFGMSYNEVGIEELDEIVDAILLSIDVTPSNVKNTDKGPSGSLSINAIKSDLQDALSLSQATISSEGGIVDWLNWLSFSGDKVVVAGYSILYGIFKPNQSRSGQAVMRRSKGFWRVPPQYSGTESNNWITRAVKHSNGQIEDAISQAVKKVLK